MSIKTAETYHVPILLQESVEGLNIQPDGIYVDVTLGGGGHSVQILCQLGENDHLFSFDQDLDTEKNISQAGNELLQQDNFTFVCSNFRYLENWTQYYEIEQIDELLADLGVSSHHFDDESRGFSSRFGAPLDMRMNKTTSITATDVVNTYSEERLADVFCLYGELKNTRRIVSLLVKARTEEMIVTTQDFIQATASLLKREREKKDMAKLFQALRIEVNHGMESLKEMLEGVKQLLRPGGRLSVITYHSLGDRIVKNMMKTGNVEREMAQDFFGKVTIPFSLINRKMIVPAEDEQQRNLRSRSAKLRIAEKK